MEQLEELIAAGHGKIDEAFRYWKTRAEWAKTNSHQTLYNAEQVERMEEGLAPQKFIDSENRWVSKELHHDPAQRDGGLFDFIEVWPDEHADLDPNRRIRR